MRKKVIMKKVKCKDCFKHTVNHIIKKKNGKITVRDEIYCVPIVEIFYVDGKLKKREKQEDPAKYNKNGDCHCFEKKGQVIKSEENKRNK